MSDASAHGAPEFQGPLVVDDALGVCPVFVSAPRRDLVYAKVLLESYEGLGITRTEQPHFEGDRALLVFLLVPDFLEPAAKLLAHLAESVDLRREPVSPARVAELKRDLLSQEDGV